MAARVCAGCDDAVSKGPSTVSPDIDAAICLVRTKRFVVSAHRDRLNTSKLCWSEQSLDSLNEAV
jgi:hypothetical protein